MKIVLPIMSSPGSFYSFLLAVLGLCTHTVISPAQESSWTSFNEPFVNQIFVGGDLYHSLNLNKTFVNAYATDTSGTAYWQFYIDETGEWHELTNYTYTGLLYNFSSRYSMQDYENGMAISSRILVADEEQVLGVFFIDTDGTIEVLGEFAPTNPLIYVLDGELFALRGTPDATVNGQLADPIMKYANGMWVPAFPTYPTGCNGFYPAVMAKYEGEYYLGGQL